MPVTYSRKKTETYSRKKTETSHKFSGFQEFII